MLFNDLAKRLGISDVALRQSLNGNPTISRLQEVADVLGVELYELFHDKGSNTFVCECGRKYKISEVKD